MCLILKIYIIIYTLIERIIDNIFGDTWYIIACNPLCIAKPQKAYFHFVQSHDGYQEGGSLGDALAGPL